MRNNYVWKSAQKNVWFGARDVADNNTFVDTFGNSMTYANWNNPNNLDREDCVYILFQSGKWNNTACDSDQFCYACEKG